MIAPAVGVTEGNAPVTTGVTLLIVWWTVPTVSVPVAPPATFEAVPTTLCVADLRPFISAPVTGATRVVTKPAVPVSVLVIAGRAVVSGAVTIGTAPVSPPVSAATGAVAATAGDVSVPVSVATGDASVPAKALTGDISEPVRAGTEVVREPPTLVSGPAAGVGSTVAMTGATIVVAAPLAGVVTVPTAPDPEAATLLSARVIVDGVADTG